MYHKINNLDTTDFMNIICKFQAYHYKNLPCYCSACLSVNFQVVKELTCFLIVEPNNYVVKIQAKVMCNAHQQKKRKQLSEHERGLRTWGFQRREVLSFQAHRIQFFYFFNF